MSCETASLPAVDVKPATVQIGFFYHGDKLTVTGESAVDDDLIVKISSPATDIAMKYKGKAGGVFWMKKGSYEFKDVPGVYMLYTSADLDRILPPEEQKKNMLGFQAIINHAEVEDMDGNKVEKSWIEEFIRMPARRQRPRGTVANGGCSA